MDLDDDDQPHCETDDPWETETWWFSFSVPERELLGYLYTFARPNLHVCGGGAMVWDGTGFLPWEVPYFEHQWTIPFTEDIRGRRLVFPTGMTLETLGRATRYAVSYQGEGLQADLEFNGIMEANRFSTGKYPFVKATHLDQPGRVMGEVRLHDEVIRVDCLAMRDRSWGGPRTDLKNTRVSYAFAAASPQSAFLVFSRPKGSEEIVNTGYFLRDGVRADVVEGHRFTSRDRSAAWPLSIRIEAVDALGRELKAEGECVNRIAFTPYPKMLNWSSLTRWSYDGTVGWGEDQDVWPLNNWRTARADIASRR
jgi:hypothetical protein